MPRVPTPTAPERVLPLALKNLTGAASPRAFAVIDASRVPASAWPTQPMPPPSSTIGGLTAGVSACAAAIAGKATLHDNTPAVMRTLARARAIISPPARLRPDQQSCRAGRRSTDR